MSGAEHWLLALAGSAAIALVTFLNWRRTRELGFVVGIGALYYWSVYGAFVFLADQSRHVITPRYDWVIASTFPVSVDDDYLLVLFYYCVFVLSAGAGASLLVKPAPARPVSNGQRLTLSPMRMLLIAGLAGGLAYWLIRDDIATAAVQNLSVYAATRAGEENQGYSFRMVAHQVLTQAALATLAMGWAVQLSGRHPRFIEAATTRARLLAYTTLTLLLLAFCMIVGRKNELLFAVLFGAILYAGNHQRPSYLGLGASAAAGLLGLGVIDAVRGFSITALVAGQSMSIGETFREGLAALSSNESVGSHFSLYGIIHWNVPPLYGESFVSLVASLVPRVLWPGRPPDIYPYYASQLGLPTDVGYSMHHVAGWYLTLGRIGVLVGGLALAAIWAGLWNLRAHAPHYRSRVMRCLAAVAFAGFTASFPALVRAGVEGYKGALIMGIAFPSLLAWLVTVPAVRVDR